MTKRDLIKSRKIRQLEHIEEQVQQIVATIRDACGKNINDEEAAYIEDQIRKQLVAQGNKN